MRESPTPPGVPVAITSPGSRVIPAEQYTISSTIEKIRFCVLESCSTSPETVVRTPIDSRSMPSAEATHGPIGANVSKLLPSVNWRSGVSSCARRPETSFIAEMPPTAARAAAASAR